MNINLTRLIYYAAICSVCFTACKKDLVSTTTKTTATTEANKAAAIRFATTFYKSVTGAYGGADFKNGLQISSVGPSNKRGPVIMSTSPLCGAVLESSPDNYIVNDTTKIHYGGHFSFTYTCSGESPDGYINNNSLFFSTKTTNTRDTLHIDQKYVVGADDNTFKLFTLNGDMQTTELKEVFNGPFYPFTTTTGTTINIDRITDHANYTLDHIKLDAASGIADLTAGIVKIVDYRTVFNKDDHNFDALTAFYCKITFLGNHLARVEASVANGYVPPPTTPTFVYTVNVLTGQIVN